jgi:hypothetical protein
MTMHQHQNALDRETDDVMTGLSRRTLLRRSFLGITAVGSVSLLTACRSDEEAEKDVDEEVDEGVQTVESGGEEVVDEVEEEVDEEGN